MIRVIRKFREVDVSNKDSQRAVFNLDRLMHTIGFSQVKSPLFRLNWEKLTSPCVLIAIELMFPIEGIVFMSRATALASLRVMNKIE